MACVVCGCGRSANVVARVYIRDGQLDMLPGASKQCGLWKNDHISQNVLRNEQSGGGGGGGGHRRRSSVAGGGSLGGASVGGGAGRIEDGLGKSAGIGDGDTSLQYEKEKRTKQFEAAFQEDMVGEGEEAILPPHLSKPPASYLLCRIGTFHDDDHAAASDDDGDDGDDGGFKGR